MNRQWGKRSDANQEDLSARIESVMDDASMDVSRVRDSSMDRRESAIVSDLPGVPNDVLDVDVENMPPEAADSVRAKAKAVDAKAAARRKKMIAMGAILGVVAIAAVAAALFGGNAAPTPAEISQVRSQFAPLPEPGAQALPVPDAGILPAPPAAPDVVLPGGLAAPNLPLPVMPQPPVADAAPTPDPAPVPAPAPVPDAALAEKLAQTQARIAELEAQNRRLQEQRAVAPAVQAPAAPRVRAFGDDVYRIFPDGLVLIDAQGRRVGIEVGETMRRYGRLISVDAAERSFRTDRGIWRAPQ